MTNQTEYPRPSIAVDLAILCVSGGALQCVLMRRPDAIEVGGDWALPGGFVHLDQSLDAAVARVLTDKTGLTDVHFEQLATYGDPNRDPRGHVISVTHLAIARADQLAARVAETSDLVLANITVNWPGEQGGAATASVDGAPLALAFDHTAILGDVVKRLRGKLDYTPIGFAFLPSRFTLRAVQEVHEAILGMPLTKPAFRRKLLDRHPLTPTGERESGGAFRPAELYELKSE